MEMKPRNIHISPGFPALVLALCTAILYLIFPMPGFRRWDSLMSATIVQDWSTMPSTVIFFFAHTLVLPLTRLVSLMLPGTDPHVVVSIREIIFAALNSALMYWGLYRILKLKRIAFLLTSLTIIFHGRWMFATQGEEKEILLFFQQICVYLTFAYLGWIKHGLPNIRHYVFYGPEGILGFTLALSVMAHLENGIMVLTIVSVLGGHVLKRKLSWKQFLLIGVSALMTGLVWFGFLIVGINGITTVAGALQWLFEYHVTGEFFSVTPHILDQAVEAWTGFRRMLIGETGEGPWMLGEMVLGTVFMIMTIKKAWKKRPGITAFFTLYLGLISFHFFFWLPWDPEQWIPTIFAGMVLVGLGWFTDGSRRKILTLGAVFTFLIFVNGYQYIQAYKSVIPYTNFRRYHSKEMTGFSGYYLRGTPYPNLVMGLRSFLPDKAIVLVDRRHLANHFRIYTTATPIVITYLDKSNDVLRNQYLLSQLSMAIYKPPLTTAELKTMVDRGVPMFFLTNDPGPPFSILERLKVKASPVLGARCKKFQLWRLEVKGP